MADEPKILCPFCSVPWSDDNLEVFDVRTMGGCSTCGYGSGAVISISITCHACEREMYRKEGLDCTD
jgi:hypothetical protein